MIENKNRNNKQTILIFIFIVSTIIMTIFYFLFTKYNKLENNLLELAKINKILDTDVYSEYCKYNKLHIYNLKTEESQAKGYQHIDNNELLKQYFTMLFKLNTNKQVVFHMNNVNTNLYAFQYDQNGYFINLTPMYKDINKYNDNPNAISNYYYFNNNKESNYITNKITKYILEVPFSNSSELIIKNNEISIIYNNNKIDIPLNLNDISCSKA